MAETDALVNGRGHATAYRLRYIPYNAVVNAFWSKVPMVSPYRFQVDQRISIRLRGGGQHRQPLESSRGMLGVIAPQMTDDWTGTKLELESGIPNVYYVALDSGPMELIAEDWLEIAPADASPPPARQSTLFHR